LSHPSQPAISTFDGEDVLTTEGTCQKLSCSVSTLRRLREQGLLTPFKLSDNSRQLYYRLGDINRFLLERAKIKSTANIRA
jgi:DNA-binding transcriptional MerR regulator